MTTAVERFYRSLLALQDDPAHLDLALKELVEISAAEAACVELPDEPVFHRATSGTAIPQQILDAVMTGGEVIEIAPRTSNDRALERSAVLCVPIGATFPIGALYLHGRRGFSLVDRERVELFAGVIASIAYELCPPRQKLHTEVELLEEKRVSEALDQSEGNISVAARELGVGRRFVYAVLRRQRERECSRRDQSRVLDNSVVSRTNS